MTPGHGQVPIIERVVLRLRRALVVMLPAPLRRGASEEMEAAFQAMVAEARARSGARGVLGVFAREVGDLLRAAVQHRRRGGGTGLRDLAREAGIALRSLLRRPAFTAVAAGTVAVGVGGATAMFALVDGVLIRPLPYRQPDRLAHVFLTIPDLGWDRGPLSAPNFDDWRRRSTVFESLSAYQMGIRHTLVAGGEPRRVVGTAVSGDLFGTLGVQPLLGRTITPGDEGAGKEPVILLSHALWRDAFGADSSVVGRRVPLDDATYTVVGVMPPDFMPLYRRATYWTAFSFDPATMDRDLNFLTVLGRLRPGVTVDAAATAMERLAREMERVDPEGLEGRSVRVESREAVVTGGIRGQLLLFLGAVGLVLVIACANLAGLMLTRGLARRRELAVRASMGARRLRLLRQLLVESLVLAGLGLVLAFPVAHLLLEVVRTNGPADLPRLGAVALTSTSWGFAALTALLCALGFGLVPGLRISRGDLLGALREGGARAGRGSSRLQRTLVVVQVGLTVALLSGAGLLAESLLRLGSVDTGFRSGDLLTFRVEPPAGAYQTPDEQDAFYRSLLDAVEAVPGVVTAGAGWSLPFGENFGSSTYRVEGRPDDEEVLLELVPVRGDWFQAMGIPIVEGRAFRSGDGSDGPPPVIISRAVAQAVWPGESAVGKRFRKGTGDEAVFPEVVGVVPDVTMRALGEEPRLLSFWPHAAVPWARDLYFAVRTGEDPLSLVPAIRESVRRVDERVPLSEVSTMDARVDVQLASPRFRTLLVGGFAAAAALLALLGVYGVTAFVVAGRTHEIGVRMALGSPQRRVLVGVLTWGAAVAVPGIVVGLLGAVVASRWIRDLLFRTSPSDPRVYAVVSILTLGATLAACWIPARRAATVDPSEALRIE